MHCKLLVHFQCSKIHMLLGIEDFDQLKRYTECYLFNIYIIQYTVILSFFRKIHKILCSRSQTAKLPLCTGNEVNM